MCVASIRNPTEQIMDYGYKNSSSHVALKSDCQCFADTTTNTNSLKAQKDKEDELAEERRRLKMERGNEVMHLQCNNCIRTLLSWIGAQNVQPSSNEHEVFEEQDLFFSLTAIPDPNSLNKQKEKGDELAQEIPCAIPVAIPADYIAVPCTEQSIMASGRPIVNFVRPA